jgi:hypothetical protein
MKPAESLRGSCNRHIESTERCHEDIAVCRPLTAMSKVLPMTCEDDTALDVDDRSIAIHRGGQGVGIGGGLRVEIDVSERRLEQAERRCDHCGDREG